MQDYTIRPARDTDIPEILDLIHCLAEHEGAPKGVRATEELLEAHLFTPLPVARVTVLQEKGSERLAGFALWFYKFSTWESTPVIHMEDLYVRAEHRGKGYGQALLSSLAAECVDRGYARMEWNVSKDNDNGRAFYTKMGAGPLTDQEIFRLEGDALLRAGGRE
ncbi:putative acetyltransferase [Corynebacterium ciconiae DSM 44920]|uniref:GNAT family N-acetyltransferase n=1 Tax=Corynebacterium ciconiae TaxID=227319 RepID=UPI00037B3D85|nr:GNAT family N-acetyltransferase [Corynebacterium ciconiae]WKD60396.1 putative acetyltransferase [Corynebacterium ciconiae DSM 44920]